METRRIGSLSVSVVGLGCNNFGTRLDAGRTTAVVHAALDAGITFFDTADIYGGTRSEEFLGRALGRRGRRHEIRYGGGRAAAWGETGVRASGAAQAVLAAGWQLTDTELGEIDAILSQSVHTSSS